MDLRNDGEGIPGAREADMIHDVDFMLRRQEAFVNASPAMAEVVKSRAEEQVVEFLRHYLLAKDGTGSILSAEDARDALMGLIERAR